MKIDQHLFETINWKKIERIKAKGETGKTFSRTVMMNDIRIRLVEYSAGYLADHWCNKGHVVFCVKGSMVTELEDGRKFKLRKGMGYKVGDESNAHRSKSKRGCTIFIVD